MWDIGFPGTDLRSVRIGEPSPQVPFLVIWHVESKPPVDSSNRSFGCWRSDPPLHPSRLEQIPISPFADLQPIVWHAYPNDDDDEVGKS